LGEAKLSEEIVEQHLSNMAAKFEPVVEWQANSIGEEKCMGYREDLPIDPYDKEMHHHSRMQEKSHPVDQLDEEIEKIRMFMLK
jgi:hypothetical protein